MNAIRTALNIGSIALLAMLGWWLVRMVVGLMNPESLYAPAPIVAPVVAATPVQAARVRDFSSDPFALPETAIIAPVQIGEDAPETTLNLTLKGIITEGLVIIQLPDGQQKNIALNETIMNGVTLEAIGKDFVTLGVNGELQRLTLERDKLNAEDGKIITRAPTPPIVPTGASPEAQRATLPSRNAVEGLLSQVEIIPYFDPTPGGLKRRGIKIKPRNGVDLSVYGLREDDVLTRIGPVLLDRNRVDIAELRTMISTGAAQDIEILRDGAPLTLRIGS